MEITPRCTEIGSVKLEKLLLQIEPKDDCWIWTGGRTPSGQPQFYPEPPAKDADNPFVAGGVHGLSASRLMWRFLKGEVRQNQRVYCVCGNRMCVNPEHRSLRSEDWAPALRPKGHGSKLTEATVKGIKSDILKGTSFRRIAAKYKVSAMTISHIANERTWKHVTD